MPRQFTPDQRVENARFIEILGDTGNARLAAREIGRKPSTMHHRRAVDAAFAHNWEAAVAAAHARFHLGGGRRGPEGEGASPNSGTHGGKKGSSPAALRPVPPPRFARSPASAKAGEDTRALRTKGGEAVVVRTRGGKLQLRFAHRDKLTKTAEQVFLAAISATANVRLSAAAAGASPAAFYRRRRRDEAFAREFRLALKMGCERLECALLQAGTADSGEHDLWRRNDPPPVPPLTADQALQTLAHHRKAIELGWDLPHRRRRRGEPWETYTARLRAMWLHKEAREAEDGALARAAARAIAWQERGTWRLADEPEPLPLPPLHLVTGWSRASGRAPHHPGVAMFGGWRIADMKARMREKRRA